MCMLAKKLHNNKKDNEGNRGTECCILSAPSEMGFFLKTALLQQV